MTVTERHVNNWAVPDHELAKLILKKKHVLLIAALLKRHGGVDFAVESGILCSDRTDTEDKE